MPIRHSATLLSLLLSTLLLQPSVATPFDPEDIFLPACGGTLPPNPPTGGWLPWSSRATWAGTAVPGVGGTAGANVTVPCGKGILLDIPSVKLTVLNILGSLKLKDDASLPSIKISAAYVIVQGRFVIGSKEKQFSQRTEITLTPNPNGRAPFKFTERQPADPANPRDIGHKAFAVIGGQVDFHGMPGDTDTRSWTRLAASAATGDKVLSVRGDVTDWPVGAPVVVAPTDWLKDQDDVARIASVTKAGGGNSRITLDKELIWNHFGDPAGVPDGFGRFIDETAEVALLRRNIVITGTDEGAPYELEGGHFIVYFTTTPQFIEGVEFKLMGQQGTLGRYNIHFHVSKDHSRSVVRKNLIIHSKQRCVVIHGTWNTRVEGNVAYNTSGHCFMTEEGGETGNTFYLNLGMRTNAVTKLIMSKTDPTISEETDDKPATFWITNPNNNLIDNAAAGSDDSGFWLELRAAVRGLSAKWARFKNVIPINVVNAGQMGGNSAHSNKFAGFRAYPQGWTPKVGATPGQPWTGTPAHVEISGFTMWKNVRMGAFLHTMDRVTISDFTFSDNLWGADLAQVQGVTIKNSRFVGVSANYGNPQHCAYKWGTWACAPASGCGDLPLKDGEQGRSVPGNVPKQSLFGVIFEQHRITEDGSASNAVVGSTFSSYDPACSPAAAIAVGASRSHYWNAGNSVRNVRFLNAGTVVTNPMLLVPRIFTEPTGWVFNGGEIATMFALRDLDGSLLRLSKSATSASGGGYIVSKNQGILPPAAVLSKCKDVAKWNALACPGVCYRSVWVSFLEPSFRVYPRTDPKNVSDGSRVLGDYSYLEVVRVEDGRTTKIEGNLRQYMMANMFGEDPTVRYFPLVLLGGHTYDITVVAGKTSPSFVPTNLTLEYKDGSGCGEEVRLRFRGRRSGGAYVWQVKQSKTTSWSPCPGNEASMRQPTAYHYLRYACSKSASQAHQVTEVVLPADLPSHVPVALLPKTGSLEACQTQDRCGLVATSTQWRFNEQNENLLLGSFPFHSPRYAATSPSWKSGRGVLAYAGWDFEEVATSLAPPEWKPRTYYFRTSVRLDNPIRCYTSLLLDLVLSDGVVVYLNGVEILRGNMPTGDLTNTTPPVAKKNAIEDGEYVYSSFALAVKDGKVAGKASLTVGSNLIAAETHVSGVYRVAFAMRASLRRQTSCR